MEEELSKEGAYKTMRDEIQHAAVYSGRKKSDLVKMLTNEFPKPACVDPGLHAAVVIFRYWSSDSSKVAIAETDNLREMLNYIADRNQIEQTERKMNDLIAEFLKEHLSIIETYITTTNEMHEFIALAGNDLRVRKIRQMLHQTDIQSNDIIQQFELMFKYINAKLTQSNCRNVAAMNEYENHLSNFQLSLNQCEIHQKNRKSASLVRKIRVRVNSLIEKIKNVEQKAPELMAQALNGVLNEKCNDDEVDDDSDDILALDDD